MGKRIGKEIAMKDKERELENREQEERKDELNPEWPQDELQDFIESQGIYIRQ